MNNLLRAAALGAAAAMILWALRRLPIARRIRASVLFSVLGWTSYWLLSSLGRPELGFLLNVVLAITILLTTNIGVQFFDLVIWDLGFGRSKVRAIPRLLIEIINVAFMLAASLVVLNRVFAVDLSALLVTSTVVSAVIGLALQDMLGNLVAGLALQFDRPFDLGDWIHVSGKEGEITQMKWRTVTLRSIDNQSIIIPNANMATNDIVNYSRPTPEQRMHIRIGLPYGSAPGEVKAILVPAVADASGVLREPSPDVLVSEYGESAIEYDVRYWIRDYGQLPEIHDEVLARVWYALQRAGLSVPFPIRDLYLRQDGDEKQKERAEASRSAIFRVLRPLPLFSPFSDEQIRELAQQAALQRYYNGEFLVHQGETGDSLFVLRSGTARVEFKNQKGVVRELAVRLPGEFFGEMSLLTGERRSASVIALTDVEAVVVNKEGLAGVLAMDASVIEELSAIVAQRLADVRQLESEGPQERGEGERVSLVNRIARFFGVG